MSNNTAPIVLGIVGCGAMGKGIAQIAAQAGLVVRLHDAAASAAQAARDSLLEQWSRQVAKGKLTAEDATACAQRLTVTQDLTELVGCNLIVEAIVESLMAKQSLLAQLMALCPAGTLFASNTSSLSITALAAGLPRARDVIGFHFFNPVPLMKVVEVIPGFHTEAAHVTRLCELARHMGHAPVVAQDTPGFIVNHAGRAYGTEAMRIMSENVTDIVTLDTILRDQAGFRLGPCELMDLTGLDVSHPVMESVYQQYYQEPRYRPSVITAQRLAAGVLGRKTGRGFYTYVDGKAVAPTLTSSAPVVATQPPVWVSPKAARRAELYQLLKGFGARIETGQTPSEQALILVAPLGFDVTTVAAVERLDPTRTVGIDMLLDDRTTARRVLATNPATRPDFRDAAQALFATDGKAVSVIRDSAGFVTQRVLAHIVNIAADMCQQAICTPDDLDTAVVLGLGYPRGPLAWGDHIGPGNVLEILFNLQTVYGDPRYRPSPWLRRRGALGLSLKQEEC